MKKFFTIIFNRILYIALFMIVQFGALFLVLRFLHEQFLYFYVSCVILSILTGLHVINKDMNPAYKIAWLIPIMLLPIFGGLAYLMYGKTRMSKREHKRMSKIEHSYKEAMALYDSSADRLAQENRDATMHSQYISTVTGVPPYRYTQTQYLPIGEEYFKVMKEELKKAEHFIFLEYFIVEEGVMWNEILNILKEKVDEGLDVRVMYDDLGCIFTLPRRYDKKLESLGIKTCVFHRFNSVLNSRFNTRDHRKICVIDGNIGITGGINLADEYINAKVKYGHWKDSGVLLKGKAVWSLTVMFLTVWDYYRNEHDTYLNFAPQENFIAKMPSDGYVQPFSDTPLDNEPVGATVYKNLINRAREYVYITTPYLIVDYEMLRVMRTAARSGVDIRIIVPGIPDKKLVYAVTKSYYELLLKDGVRIYQYTPGFMHAKNCVVDDEYAVVGTINLDFRSMYLHFECAAWMCRSKAVGQAKEDFMETLELCTEITMASLKKKNLFHIIGLSVIRAFAPLM